MEVGNIVKLIKSIIWLIVGLIVLPIAAAVLWLLILMMISVNLENGSTFGFVMIYLVTFLGITITAGMSLWFWKVVKQVLMLTKIKEVVEKQLRKHLE